MAAMQEIKADIVSSPVDKILENKPDVTIEILDVVEEKASGRLWNVLRALHPKRIRKDVKDTYHHLKKVSSESWRVIHSIKVAIALTFVTAYILISKKLDDVSSSMVIGHNGIWALMTVVVVFESSVGATFSKGLNRGIGTFLAVVLALGLSQVAELGGNIGQEIVTCAAIFLVGVGATFMRFVPKVRARYDYGVMIFLLTFSLLMIVRLVSQQPLEMAMSRLYMIILGCTTVICITLVCPHWAGDDLHGLIVGNFDKLGKSLEHSVQEYVSSIEDHCQEKNFATIADDLTYKNCVSIFTCSSNEQSLANFATWEPPRGKFKRSGWRQYPWIQYVHIGSALRHCAFTSMALHGCLSTKIQTPQHRREMFKTELLEVSSLAASVIRLVGYNLEKMQKNEDNILEEVTNAAKILQEKLNAESVPVASYNIVCSLPSKACNHNINFTDDVPKIQFNKMNQTSSDFSNATFVSLLIESVARLHHLVEAVDKLAIVANFPKAHSTSQSHKITVPSTD